MIESFDDLSDEDRKIIVLLAIGEISGFNSEAAIPIKEIVLYVHQNFDELYSRLLKGKQNLPEGAIGD